MDKVRSDRYVNQKSIRGNLTDLSDWMTTMAAGNSCCSMVLRLEFLFANWGGFPL